MTPPTTAFPAASLVDAWVSSRTGNRHLLLVNDGRELPRSINRQRSACLSPISAPGRTDGFRGVVLDNGAPLSARRELAHRRRSHRSPLSPALPLDPATVDQLAQGLGIDPHHS